METPRPDLFVGCGSVPRGGARRPGVAFSDIVPRHIRSRISCPLPVAGLDDVLIKAECVASSDGLLRCSSSVAPA